MMEPIPITASNDVDHEAIEVVAKITDDLALVKISTENTSRYEIAAVSKYTDALGYQVIAWYVAYPPKPILDYFIEKYGNNPVE